MFSLPEDILLLILYNLTDINDIINLSFTNSVAYKLFDNLIYIYWGINLYSKEFWEKAEQRTPDIAKPLINMKMELVRLDKFKKNQINCGHPLWNNDDYYQYWDAMEKYYEIRGTRRALVNTPSSRHNFSRQHYSTTLPTNEEIDRMLTIL